MEAIQEMQSADKFFQEHPLTLQELLKWEMENLQKLQSRVKEITNEPEAVEDLQIMDSDVKDMVIGAFAMSPRFMFEFFDSKAMIVEIRHRDGGFFYVINGKESDQNYVHRLEAEKAAFTEAVKINEDNLSDN